MIYVADIEDEPGQEVTWDAGETLEKLPPVPDLSLTAPCALRITSSVKFEALTTLSFRHLQQVDVLAVLSLCTQLSYLRLLNVTSPEPTSPHVTSHSLRTLIVNTTNRNEWWLQQISCPNLTAFHHGSDFLQSSMSIFESYTSLFTLEYASTEQLLPTFATATPLIQSLGIETLELRIFCKLQTNGKEAPPFSCLEELNVSLIDAELTLDDFELIVRARCLPTSHPQSQLPPSLTPLRDRLMIVQKKIPRLGGVAHSTKKPSAILQRTRFGIITSARSFLGYELRIVSSYSASSVLFKLTNPSCIGPLCTGAHATTIRSNKEKSRYKSCDWSRIWTPLVTIS
jgi:hypothetical protein